ncbi:MAG TPA: hypothetical protein VNI61_01060 [Gemmatimonadales bacterium]|nr:hypothetical protein [Gemmatimonadales bacterium]
MRLPVAPAAILLLAPALAAQSPATPPAAPAAPAAPTLTLTIFGGAITGHDLWTVERQPVCILSGATCSAEDDTVRLARQLSPSLVLGLSAAYFPGPALGFQGEIVYLGLPIDDTCGAAAFRDQRNADLCADVTAAAGGGSAIAFFLGATVRPSPFSALSPYARLGAGVVAYSSSTIEVVGTYLDGGRVRTRELIADAGGGRARPGFLAAVGITSALGPGYRFRLELRDVYGGFDTVTGPANRQGLDAATGSAYHHHIGLVLGLDIVLEHKRGRRY